MSTISNHNPDLCLAVTFNGSLQIHYIPIIAWDVSLDIELEESTAKPIVPHEFHGYESECDRLPVTIDRSTGTWSNGKHQGSDLAELNRYLSGNPTTHP